MRFERAISAFIRKDPSKIHLTGYTDIEERKTTILDKETFTKETLQKNTILF